MRSETKPQTGPFWANIALDRRGQRSLQRQLFALIRDGIVSGALQPGSPLPASRILASELGCSRNTVLEVVAQLLAEGYVASHRGSGVFVVEEVPDRSLLAQIAPASTVPEPSGTVDRGAGGELPGLSRRGQSIVGSEPSIGAGRHVAFSASIPDVALFPLATWMQLHAQEWRERGDVLVKDVDPRGYLPLRQAIAQYVRAARNVVCEPDQVIVTSGAQHGIDLAARVLLDPDDCAWIEDPGYPPIGALFRAAGARTVPVPLDAEGMTLDVAREIPRVIAIAPSHQFPTGVRMSLERRVALVDFAERVGAWIIEDDYDSEFRYEGQPLQSLSSLTEGASEHVIYIGTFSKMLFPAIRLGYMIVPMRLADTFAYARAMIDLQPSIVAQPTLTRFVADGHLAMHVRRMRIAYRERRAVLLDALAEHAAGLLCAESQHAGMHLIASFTPHLRRRMDDKAAARLLAERGITAHPMSQFYAGPARSEGLLLGYACVDADALRAGVVQMAAALRA